MMRDRETSVAKEAAPERARLIATASMVLDVLRELRVRQEEGDDVAVVERWIVRVGGLLALLRAISEWQGAEAYDVNWREPGAALRRLFPCGLDSADFEDEVRGLRRESHKPGDRASRRPPPAPLTEDDALEDLLRGHAGGRFRYVDVRGVAAWRRERLQFAAHIPLARLRDEASKAFPRETSLVVFGADEEETCETARILEQAGFSAMSIPAGFDWFRRRNWEIDRGPSP